MNTPTSQYPDRPKFFALKFARLVAKASLANRIGADACWLLTCIALTEDAKGYRDSVTYFNSQLMSALGVSEDSLARVRAKAIDAGWLHYSPGRRGVAGTYWVLIPEVYRGVGDGPADEDPHEYAPSCTPEFAGSTRLTLADSGVQLGVTSASLRGKAGGKGGGKPGESTDPSSSPFPNPKDTHAAEPRPPAESVHPKPEPKSPPKPAKSSGTQPGHAEAVAGFTDAWQAKYREKYFFQKGKDGAAVKAMLDHVNGDVAKFLATASRFLADADAFYAAGSRHSLAKFRSNFVRWLARPPAAPARRWYDEPD